MGNCERGEWGWGVLVELKGKGKTGKKAIESPMSDKSKSGSLWNRDDGTHDNRRGKPKPDKYVYKNTCDNLVFSMIWGLSNVKSGGGRGTAFISTVHQLKKRASPSGVQRVAFIMSRDKGCELTWTHFKDYSEMRMAAPDTNNIKVNVRKRIQHTTK